MKEKRFSINQDNSDLDRLVDCEHEWVADKDFNTNGEVICKKCNLRSVSWTGTIEITNSAPHGIIKF